jgi:rare lipoprotein A
LLGLAPLAASSAATPDAGASGIEPATSAAIIELVPLRPTADVTAPASVIEEPAPSAPQETVLGRGSASYYASKFNGRRTASGERFDNSDLTAAHRSLPFGSRVRVTNPANGRSVVVRVNDRGPFVDNRIIDLSYTAAHKLAMTRAGTAFVEVEVITPGTLDATAHGASPAPVPQTMAAPVLYLQAGAFGVAANAEQLAQRLRREGIESVRVLEPDTTSSLYRVRVGPIPDVAAFDATAQRVSRLGVESRLISE